MLESSRPIDISSITKSFTDANKLPEVSSGGRKYINITNHTLQMVERDRKSDAIDVAKAVNKLTADLFNKPGNTTLKDIQNLETQFKTFFENYTVKSKPSGLWDRFLNLFRNRGGTTKELNQASQNIEILKNEIIAKEQKELENAFRALSEQGQNYFKSLPEAKQKEIWYSQLSDSKGGKGKAYQLLSEGLNSTNFPNTNESRKALVRNYGIAPAMEDELRKIKEGIRELDLPKEIETQIDGLINRIANLRQNNHNNLAKEAFENFGATVNVSNKM